MLTAAPLFAQERAGQDVKGYVTGLDGFARSVGNTTGDMGVESGVQLLRT